MLGWRQFLPQDKVASFAQLKPGELLIETERAIGDASLHALHLDLIKSRAELRRLEMVRGLECPSSRVCLFTGGMCCLCCRGACPKSGCNPRAQDYEGWVLHCAGACFPGNAIYEHRTLHSSFLRRYSMHAMLQCMRPWGRSARLARRALAAVNAELATLQPERGLHCVAQHPCMC